MARLPKIDKEALRRKAATHAMQIFQDYIPALKENLRVAIVNRALEGKGYSEQSLKPYSASYAKYKKALHLPTTPNISLTGELLRSLKVVQDKRGNINTGYARFRIEFDDEPRAWSNKVGLITNNLLADMIIKGTSKMPPRNFVNLSQEELKKIVDDTIDKGLYKREDIPVAVET